MKAQGIGERLRKVRIHYGMTQQELADKLGVSKAIISSYEQNKTMPSFAKLIELATMFGVTTDYLLSFGDEQIDERFDSAPADDEAAVNENDKARRLGARLMGIGREIKELREERGLSRQELADALSLSITAINKYESDMMAPSYKTLLEMAEYFNVTTERLFGIETGRKLDISALPEDKKNLLKNIVRGMK